MAQDYIVKDGELKSIANAIRSKTGNPDPLTFPTEFVSEIGTLSKPNGTIQITQNGSVNVRDYANANVSVSPVLQEKTGIVPTENSQTITADPPNQGLSSVQIDPIDSNYVGSDVPRRDSTDLTDSGATVSVPAGYYGSNASKTVASGSATTPATTITANPSISVDSSGLITATASASQNITPTVSEGYVSGGTAGAVTVSGSNTSQLSTQSGTTVNPTESEQTAVASGKYTTGTVKVGAISSTYVGSGITRCDSTDLTANGATVTAPSGYYENSATKSIGSGSVTAPSTISGSTATVSTGTNTLTLTKTVSVTPNVTTAGYISSGTAGNASVSLSASVTTKAAATYYPSSSDQTISASQYLTGAQTIKAVAVSSNLTAENIKKDVVVTVGDSVDADRIMSVTGTYEGGGGGGASNLVTGTFKGTTTASSMDITLNYSGSGYPIMVAICPIEGPSNSKSGSFYSLVQRYAIRYVFAFKSEMTTAPSYSTPTTIDNMIGYVVYKNSSTNNTVYSQSSLSSNVYADSSASNSTSACVRLRSSTKMAVYIAGSSYGFAANQEYRYAVVYSS